MSGDGSTILAADRPHLLHRLVDLPDLEARGIDLQRPGLTDGSESLSFGEYADAVARLAAWLVEEGVAPGDRVALRLRKSVWSFIGVHAVLRAGAVMVPLDPMAPVSNARALLVDAGAETLISDAPAGQLTELIDGTPVRRVVSRRDVDDDRVIDWNVALATDPGRAIDIAEDDPAYIIYTSGSTGVPKGIVHTHASAWAYAARAAAEYELHGGDRLANIAALHFDQSTFELYAAPLAGAAAIVVPDAVLKFPASLSRLIESATVWYTVPYTLRQLSTRGALEDRDLSALRWVLFGGEVFPPGELVTLMAQVPGARFSNVYGPAEVNQCTAYHFDVPPGPDGVVPIGRPWADTEVAVVDGELLVATPTMMRGYWHRDDLTGAAIVDRGDDRRWYRTGDLVGTDDEGNLVFLGRADHQVKIRGQRVELEAVESALLDLDAVAEAGVVAIDEPDGAALVAAVIAAGDSIDTRATLRALNTRLPAAAVPSTIFEVESLPRTASGKIDRPALRASVASGHES